MWLPEDWEYESDKTRIVGFSSDSAANIYFYVIEDRKSEQVLNNIVDELSQLVDYPIFVNRPRRTRVNGLKAYLGDGSGAIEGIPVRWNVGMYEVHGKVLLAVGLYVVAAAKDYEDPIEKIVKSVKEEDPY